MKIKVALKLLRGEARFFWIRFFLIRDFQKKGVLLLARHSSLQVDRGSSVKIGKRVTLGSGSLLACRKGASLNIGDGVYVNRNCTIVSRESIDIEKGVTIGPNCCIFDHDHDLKNKGEYVLNPIVIKEGAWIGAGCIILKGVTIGKGAVVAAGTIVTKDVPDHSVVRGRVEYVYKKMDETE